MLGRLVLPLLRRYPQLYYRWLYHQQLRRLRRMLESGENYFKVVDRSLRDYAAYDDREQRQWETGGWECLIDGRIRWASAKEIRSRYVDALCREIDDALAGGAEPSVLEVGCGNCINLVLLKERYGNRLSLAGMDISSNRLSVARKFFGTRLDGIRLEVVAVAELSAQGPQQHGIVFSMHCLEQVPNHLPAAIRNMISAASGRVIFIEPEWELARPAQRVYLTIADHARTILATLRDSGRKIRRAEALDVQSSLKNQSSIIVVDGTRSNVASARRHLNS